MDFFSGENGVEAVYAWAIPLHATIIFSEMIYSHISESNLYSKKDLKTNIYLALMNFGLDFMMKVFAFAVMFFFFQYRIFSWEYSWMYWISCFLITDFAYYVLHYVDHHSRAFWAIHITHHNSEFFNITTGFRSPVLQPLYRYLYFVPLAFIGFNPWHIMVVYAIGQVYGTWVHTQTIKKMGFLEYFLVTPSHHRVHHACNIKYLDRNMGMCLIIWDKIFRTFEKEDANIPVKYGIYPKMPDEKLQTVLSYEWQNIWKDLKKPDLKFMDKLNYIFNSPGWKHDGTGKTVRQYQKDYFEMKDSNNI